MHKLTLMIACFILATQFSYAQRSSRAARNEMTCPKLYLGVTLGIENPPGLIGFNVDVPVTQSLSLSTGFGRSSWGWKTFGEARYYFGRANCNRGWALGAGVTYNTGISSFQTLLPTTIGDQTVTLDLNPKMNAFLGGYRFWNLGRNGNRFYVGLGYSFRLDEDNYVVKSNHTLTSDGKQVMQVLAPGGLMISVGFSFGILR